MPSKHMLPKGKRRHSVKAEYRAQRTAEVEAAEVAQAAAWEAGEQPLAGAEAPAAEESEAVARPPRRVSVPRVVVVPQVDLDPYGPDAATARQVVVPEEARGLRLDLYLARAIPEISRSRVQLLIEGGQVRVNGVVAKGKQRLLPGEVVGIEGSPVPPPMEAKAEAIPLEVMYEDEWLAVVNKPAGMSVHAGAAKARAEDGAEDDDASGEARDLADARELKDSRELKDPREMKDPRTSGTLVNALLHHFAGQLSGVGGELRPGIVHRLDKETSGLLLVAKDDRTHKRLGDAFAERRVEKRYLALVHGALRMRVGQDEIRVDLPIGRDLVRRTRMTTRRPPDAPGVRNALSFVKVLERIDGPWGEFTLVEVRIETGRTHQIRVHLQALGHPVVGDATYGAPERVVRAAVPRAGRASMPARAAQEEALLRLGRNFLHARHLRLEHPQTGKVLELQAALPSDLEDFLALLRG